MEKDMQKVVKCLRACATGSFKACKACSYRKDCNQLITDALELLEKGCDLSKEVHPVSKNREENKRIVREGLDRRKAARLEAQNEARLEQFERDMIRACNENSANAKIERMAVAADRSSKTQSRAKIASRKNAKYRKMERENGTIHAVMLYVLAVAGLFWLTTWTHLPAYAAITCAISFFPFLPIYVSRLYEPIEESMEVA